MAKAKITLTDSGPLTFHGKGYSFARGESIITTKPDDILYFQSKPGFNVDITDAPAPVVSVTVAEGGKKTTKKVTPKAVEIVEEGDEDDEGEEDEDEEAEEDDEAEAEDAPVTGALTEAELKPLTLNALKELALENKVKFDDGAKKADLIKALLKKKG